MPILPFAVDILKSSKHGTVRSGRSLEYETTVISSGQDVNDGRILLTPKIDLKKYRFTAAIDWIEIAFNTPGKHQALNVSRHIERRLGFRSWVSGPVRDKAGYKGQSFILRLQSPAPNEFWRLCDELEGSYYRVRKIGRGAIRVTGVEVALDIYPKSGCGEERQLMSEVVRRHHLPDIYYWLEQDRWPRSFYWAGRNPIWPINAPTRNHKRRSAPNSSNNVTAGYLRDLSPDSYRQAPVDGTFYEGKKEGELLFRIQDKVADKRDKRTGSEIELAPDQRRTRIELQVGYGAFEGCGAMYRRGEPFRFVDVMRNQFQLLLPSLTPDDVQIQQSEWEVFKNAGVLGLDRYQRALLKEDRLTTIRSRKGERRPKLGVKGRAKAWSEFNKRGRGELEHLDERWRRR
ncbi:hypothetical protein [Aliiruegeria sabulilitoris]|uniref:hypothetical protein n=1 Tax=Aliiruegeria sabulilitoris TaxID=1510458 RepID=UPI000836B71D|nr:hypothetical protein [Aliiruegeria sabulilitoris]NDR55477.1 hypothetical protein [Pseudoruegeria sp. M32A2M]